MSDTKEKYWDFIWNQPDLPEKIKLALTRKNLINKEYGIFLDRKTKKLFVMQGVDLAYMHCTLQSMDFGYQDLMYPKQRLQLHKKY